MFARGDRRLAASVVEAWKLGCKFDGWTEYFDYDAWMQAFQNTNIDPEYYADGILSQRRKEYEDYLKKVREKRKEPKEKIPTLFDLEFKDELKFFNLYNIDFTFNDLKRVKRELVKQHHPDQFNDLNEKEMHRDLYEKTIKYYKTIVDAKKF